MHRTIRYRTIRIKEEVYMKLKEIQLQLMKKEKRTLTFSEIIEKLLEWGKKR